ncbi:esterase family protein [Candidatus Bipolaricaulota bacterium]|nr:esterase family protein [Candidatus Bipolaricaulota bacterium]
MSLVNFSYRSRVLGKENPVDVILPRPFRRDENGDLNSLKEIPSGGFPVLYLLHGLSDDQSAWTRKSSIERYVASHELAVVMPNVDQSFYTDMACGQDYWTYLTNELTEVCHRYFPLSSRRADNFVAGLSMGGYGAFKWALRKPDKFAAAASLSGSLDIAGTIAGLEGEEKEKLEWIFGDLEDVEGSNNDLIALARGLANSRTKAPKLFQCCGTDDFLYESNLRFKDAARELSLELTYKEEGGTGHEWDYWDRMIGEVLGWLPLDR